MPKTRAYYGKLSREFRDRADCTAGVRLSFITEAELLSFSAEVISFCRSRNVVDVFENGIMTGSRRLADMQSSAEFQYRRRTKGKAQIDLWLPNTCGIRLKNADFGECIPTRKPKRRFLILGDSILQGIDTYHPTNAVVNQLMMIWDAEGINQSVGGAQFFPETLEPLPLEIDRILVALGGNDAFHPEEDREERISVYFHRLRELYPDTPTVALTPVWTVRMEDNLELREEFRKVSECIADEAQKHHVSVIDGNRLVPHEASFFNEDGIHPNDTGFLQYALNLATRLSWNRWQEVI